jgi:SAM-dependent methyltransferase
MLMLQRRCATFASLEYAMWRLSAGAYDGGFGQLTSVASRPLLNAVGITAGTGMQRKPRLLDVATGPGYLAEMAGPDCESVVAMDFVPEMVELAAKRTAHSPTVTVVRGDAQDLPFATGSFDAVTCAFGVLHLESPSAFFQEAHRCLRPGGRLSFSVWAPPGPRSAFTIVNNAISAHGDPNVKLPSSESTPSFFFYGDPHNALAALGEAGFDPSSVRSVELPLRFTLREPDDLYVMFAAGTGRTRALLEVQSVEAREAIRSAMAIAMNGYLAADGEGYDIPAVAIVYSAMR